MFNRIFGTSGSESSTNNQPRPEPFILLVIQADDYDWEEIMKTVNPEMKIKNRPIQVIQTSWDDLQVGPCDNYSRDPRHRCMITVRKIWKNGKAIDLSELQQQQSTSTSKLPPNLTTRAVFPDFVLIRNEVTVPQKDFKNKLMGLMYSDVPSINSLRSIYLTIDRPLMMASLNKIALKTQQPGTKNQYPMKLIPQQFFTGHQAFMYAQKFPAVIKFGSAHAGFGKMKVVDHHQMEDVQSVLPMTSSGYAFGEPFLNGQCDLRLQRLGEGNYRAFRRVSVCGNWKTQTGTAVLENIEVSDKYKSWLDAASTMFGETHDSGKMDILTLDVLVEEGTGEEFVLEVNGTSSGFGEEKEATEDNLILAKLVLERILKL